MSISNYHYENVACDSCGATQCPDRLQVSNYNPVSKKRETFNLVECQECKLVYLNPRPDADALKALYAADAYDRSKKLDASNANDIRSPGVMEKVALSLWHLYCGQYLSYVLNRVNGRVLDIGCGTGDLMVAVKQRGCEVIGVDMDPDAIAVARNRSLNATYGTVFDLDIENESLDSILLWHTLEHFQSPAGFLAKAHRLLKANGRIWGLVPNVSSSLAEHYKDAWTGWSLPFHLYHFNRTSLSMLAHKHGFEVVRMSAVTQESTVANSCWNMAKIHTHKAAHFNRLARFSRTLPGRVVVAGLERVLDFFGEGEFIQFDLRKLDK